MSRTGLKEALDAQNAVIQAGEDAGALFPAMWWRCKGEWPACGIVWADEGTDVPVATLRATSWEALNRLLERHGMKLDLPEEEAKGGHGAEPIPTEPSGMYRQAEYFKRFVLVEHTDESHLEISGRKYDTWAEFLLHFDVEDAPEDWHDVPLKSKRR